MSKPTAYIFDVDGTLVNVDSILYHLTTEPKNFNAFHRDSINMPPHDHVVDMLNQAKDAGHAIVVVTARKERWRALTSFWLAMHEIHSDALFMRPDSDGRPDRQVKLDIYRHISQCWDVVHAVDDNPTVIRLWEKLNIPVTKIGSWEL